jgi:hypothetical protein
VGGWVRQLIFLGDTVFEKFFDQRDYGHIVLEKKYLFSCIFQCDQSISTYFKDFNGSYQFLVHRRKKRPSINENKRRNRLGRGATAPSTIATCLNICKRMVVDYN